MPPNETSPTAPRPPVRTRRPIAETRRLLIETGLEMLTGEASATVGRIELIEVCRRAGLTTAGSAYKIWETQEDYRLDLLRHVLATIVPGRESIDLLTEAIAEDPAGLPSLTELIRSTTTDLGAADPPYTVYVTLWLAALDDPQLATALDEDDTEVIDGLADLYAKAAEVYDREWVVPDGPRIFSLLVSSLTEGLAIRGGADPGRAGRTLARQVDSDEAKPWSLLASSVLAFTEALTRPRSTDAPSEPGR